MGLLDRAARFIDDVLLLPDDVRGKVEAAEAKLHAGQLDEAESMLREVLAERPSLLSARRGLALVLRARGDLARARAVVDVSRQLDPDDTETALLGARLALEAEDLSAAIEQAREAARRSAKDGGPRFAAACVIRARAERARGRPDRAVRELRKALAADPGDDELRVELAEALAASGRGASAAAALRGVQPGDVEPQLALRLGTALADVEERARAKPLLERAAEAGLAGASVKLAAEALDAGELDDAEQHARTAVARRGGAVALSTLAEVLTRLGRRAEAAEALLAASEMSGGDLARVQLAARICPLDAVSELAHIADRLDAAHAGVVQPGADAGRGLGRAVRAWAELGGGSLENARALTRERGDEPRLELARARLAVLDRRPADALEVLAQIEGLEAGDGPMVRAVRSDALRALWRGETGMIDLAAAIDEVARFAEQRDLDDVQRRAHALRDELDRPLLLAILGEFNAGKSTLVNAFVGADVAPTGIFPTTATLNVIRAGAERRVRLVRKDGTTKEGEWSQLKQMLADADEAGAAVDHVEIVLPSELLERVWILDTPGSNAPVPEHEALAAEALRRADAALWVFDSGQAGKATEGKILQAIRASRRQVVGALNKMDRLTDVQLAEVRAALARDLPELSSGDKTDAEEVQIVALSAKRALKARLAGDDEGFEASGFSALMRRLEADVFQRSRHLKHRACGGRLLALLDDALRTEEQADRVAAQRIASLEALRRPLAKAGRGLDGLVDDAIAFFERAQQEAFEAAAREVLSFVRPRTSRFARHGADLEDRAFLGEVIEQRTAHAAQTCEARLVDQIARALAAQAGALGVSPDSLLRRARSAVAPAVGQFAGFQDGLLAGGGLKRFFDDDLPRAELALAPLTEALAVYRAHPRERLRPMLLDAVAGLADELERTRAEAVASVRRETERTRDRVYEPLRALRSVLEELAD